MACSHVEEGPDASESGYLEHIERKKLDRMYIFDLNLMASPTYPNVQSVKKVEGLCLELYQRNPDDFYAKLFVQRLSKFGGEYTLASDVFGVVEDAALGRRAILDQGQMACREEAAASHGLRAPAGDSADQRHYSTRTCQQVVAVALVRQLRLG